MRPSSASFGADLSKLLASAHNIAFCWKHAISGSLETVDSEEKLQGVGGLYVVICFHRRVRYSPVRHASA
jgi:hypothetical protein